MSFGYLVPLVLGAVVYYFAEDVVDVRRFGPITDGTQSSETGGLAFRIVGLLLIGVGVLDLLQTSISL